MRYQIPVVLVSYQDDAEVTPRCGGKRSEQLTEFGVFVFHRPRSPHARPATRTGGTSQSQSFYPEPLTRFEFAVLVRADSDQPMPGGF